MSPKLGNIVKILEFTNQFQLIKRTVFVPNELPRRFENDSEHTFQIALTAWYLIDSQNLPLDKDLVIKYALVHDLVETYAGDLDPYMYANDPDFPKKKAENETNAFKKIKQNFDEFQDMLKYIEAYEHKADEESLFVYSLDKIAAQLSVSELDKRTLRDCGISRQTIEDNLKPKIMKSKYLADYYNEILELWDTKEGFYADTDFIPDYKKKFLSN